MSCDIKDDGLLGISEFVVPRRVLEGTLVALAESSRRRQEGFVLWGAQTGGRGCLRFSSVVQPQQQARSTSEGELVVVGGDALFAVNKLLYERSEVLAGQVHTHPTEAYHSSTDDEFPLVTLLGGISVVIPNFGDGGLKALERWAWYRLIDRGEWVPLDEGLVTFA